MRKKLALAMLVAITFLVMPDSFAKENVQLFDQVLTDAEAQQLNIVVPADTDPGYHVIRMQIYDDGGVLSEKKIPFCKRLDGRVNWNNICPGMDPVLPKDELILIKWRGSLPLYHAGMEPKKQSKTMVAIFAALALIATGTRSLTQVKVNTAGVSDADLAKKHGAERDDPGSLEINETGKIGSIQENKKWGDRSWIWRFPGHAKVDYFFDLIPLKIDRISPLAARAMTDGDWLRAIFGSLTLLVYGAGIWAGYTAAASTGFQALPPSMNWVIVLAAFGIMDAFAGLMVSVTFAISIAAHGYFDSVSAGITVVVLSIAFSAPALIASAFRPFRRETLKKGDRWELLTDIALVSLLGGWALKNLIVMLPAISRLQLPISEYANQIGIAGGLLIFIRVCGENIGIRVFPRRINDVTTDFETPSKFQRLVALTVRSAIFYFAASQFIGRDAFVAIGAAFFAFPQLLAIVGGSKIKKYKWLQVLTPHGTILAISIVFIGYFATAYVQQFFTSTLAFFRVSFLALMAPVFLAAMASLFSNEDTLRDWNKNFWNKAIYRLAGIAIYCVLTLIVFGVDVPGITKEFVLGFIN